MPATSNETVTLDPPEFIQNRVELALDALGLNVVDAEWGDSDHELFLIRQEKGEIPGDRHPPNRTVTLKLRARAKGTLSLAEIEERLQMKVGRIQDEGGWVKRIPDSSGGFSTPVGMIVHTAVLGGLSGWLRAHRKTAPAITLVLTVGPYCYGTKETASAEFKVTEARSIEAELSEVKGTAPGLMRVRAKNEGALNWMGAICAIESRDHSSAATALLMYEAENLTLLGAAAKATRTGASGGGANNVVKSGSLSANWAALLYSKISASALHMTHTGNRRILLRLWDPNSVSSKVRFKLEWRVLGSNRWISNEEQATFLSGNFSFVDLGEVRPEVATLGEQRWEFRVCARTTGTIGEEVQMDCIFPIPTEQFAIVQEFIEIGGGGTTRWEDSFQQAEGAATGKVAPIGGTYEGFKAGTDYTVKPSKSALTRTAKGEPRIIVGSASSSTYTSFEGEVIVPGASISPSLSIQGYVFRFVDENNYLIVSFDRLMQLGPSPKFTEHQGCGIRVRKVVAGVTTFIGSFEGKTFSEFESWLNGGELGVLLKTNGDFTITVNGVTLISGNDAVLKTGGALAEGRVGVYDSLGNTNPTSPERLWQQPLSSTLIGGEEPVYGTCFAGRLMEFRSEGVFRQHQTDDVWARLTPDGFLPYAPQSGLEARAAKIIVLPSVGNFENIADSEKIKGTVQVFHFPGYHFASEAV